MDRISVVIPCRQSDAVAGVEIAARMLDLGAAEAVPSVRGSAAEGRNHGAETTSGDIILFMDADCEPLDVSWLSTRPTTEAFWVPKGYRMVGKAQRLYSMLGAFFMTACHHLELWPVTTGTFMAVRRDAFTATGGFLRDEVLEDWNLGKRLLQHGYKPGYAPFTVYVNRPYHHWNPLRGDGPALGYQRTRVRNLERSSRTTEPDQR